jgi:pimeloyl-ACP methyl ester carboxylesterase
LADHAGTDRISLARRGAVVALGLVALGSGCGAAPEAPELPVVEGIEHFDVPTGNGRWHRVEAGEGEPVVLIHGLPETWHAWHRVIPRLANDYRVVVPDLEGFGDSDLAPGPHGWCDVADRLAPLLEEVAPGGYHLAGQDWGAFVGACLASSRPDAVRSYVHVSAPLDMYDLTRMPDYRDFYLTPEAIHGLMRNVELFVTRVYDAGVHGGSEALPPGVLARRIRDFADHQDTLTAYFEDLELDRRWRFQGASRADWEAIGVPVTVVIGDRDLLVPQELFRNAADRVPGFRRVVVIDEAGHFPAEEQPDQLATALREAFAR